MNVQTEYLQDQTARFTVEVDLERLEKAKQQSARTLAKKVNIPGFRKGKIPYRVLIQNGLESQILMDAIENLSQEVYRETLEQSDLAPYGPGAFEDYKVDPVPTFIYTVPLQPTVDLKDYLSIRADYKAPTVTDDDVNKSMKLLQEQEALVEESNRHAEAGNRVVLDIHSHFVNEDGEEETNPDGEDEEASEEVHGHSHSEDEESFIHEHDAQIYLNTEDKPIMSGFIEQIIGANPGDELEFELTIPEDELDYSEEIRGRKVHFHVGVKKVEIVTLPELNDDLAARITKDEAEPLTLLQLRVRMRENLETQTLRQSKEQYSDEVLSKIVEQAEVAYPEAMVEDQIDSILNDLDSRMKQQGMTLDMYMRVTNMTKETLREQYRENAIASLKRGLVLREIVSKEKIQVADSQITERINEVLKQFGEQAESVRSIFDTPSMRSAMINDIIQERAHERLFALGRGESWIQEQPLQVESVQTDDEASVESASITSADAEDEASENTEESSD